MGLKLEYLTFINSNIGKVFSSTLGLKMLELGDQVIKETEPIEQKTGKDYFSHLGYNHTSVDLNGDHGAIVKDLTKEEQFLEWYNYFDIVTNAGTTEHVEPYDKQYECYKILHNVAKVGAVTIHLIPDVDERDNKGIWWKHCHYYYSYDFFEMLAKECEYKILDNVIINGLRSVAYVKTKDNKFMTDKDRFLSYIAQRNFTKEHFRPK